VLDIRMSYITKSQIYDKVIACLTNYILLFLSNSSLIVGRLDGNNWSMWFLLSSSSDSLSKKNLKEKKEYIKNLCVLKINNKQSDNGGFALPKRHNKKKLLGREKQENKS